MEAKKYSRITKEERVKIEVYLGIGKGESFIAKQLCRDRSAIYREIKRSKSEYGWGYKADHAQFRTDLFKYTRRIDTKLEVNEELLHYVELKLKEGWSPEQISNRLKEDTPKHQEMWISCESIYKYIYGLSDSKERKRLINLLTYKKPKRFKSERREGYKGKILDRTPINERPLSVEDRKEPGHWEGDLIVGIGHKSAIGTLVERTTRYTLIIPLDSMKSSHVVTAFAAKINELRWGQNKSMTYDNGTEMSAHKVFTELTGLPVYFADPNSSWQRGTNENTNGLIRRVFKKKTDFNKISPMQLNDLQDKLNNRPRKILGWKTPNERLLELCA